MAKNKYGGINDMPSGWTKTDENKRVYTLWFGMLRRCYELWLCGDWQESRGCNMEYGFAKAKGIPVKFICGSEAIKK